MYKENCICISFVYTVCVEMEILLKITHGGAGYTHTRVRPGSIVARAYGQPNAAPHVLAWNRGTERDSEVILHNKPFQCLVTEIVQVFKKHLRFQCSAIVAHGGQPIVSKAKSLG